VTCRPNAEAPASLRGRSWCFIRSPSSDLVRREPRSSRGAVLTQTRSRLHIHSDQQRKQTEIQEQTPLS
jgi:hypothetical protein